MCDNPLVNIAKIITCAIIYLKRWSELCGLWDGLNVFYAKSIIASGARYMNIWA